MPDDPPGTRRATFAQRACRAPKWLVSHLLPTYQELTAGEIHKPMMLIAAAMRAAFFIVGVLPVDRFGARDHRCRWPESGLINHVIAIREQFVRSRPSAVRDSKDVACYRLNDRYSWRNAIRGSTRLARRAGT